jgi:hypothetical protein
MTGWLAYHHPPEIPRSPLGLEEVAAQPLVYHGPFGSMIVCGEGEQHGQYGAGRRLAVGARWRS